MLDRFGIRGGHIETIHSFTNDQNLIDNYHSKPRRGRSAVLNMVITETGAAKAVLKCFPQLKGCLTANSIRVPTPDVSLAILNLQLECEGTTVAEVNGALRHAALATELIKQIEYSSNDEAVSSDFVGSRAASIVDAHSTSVRGNNVRITQGPEQVY